MNIRNVSLACIVALIFSLSMLHAQEGSAIRMQAPPTGVSKIVNSNGITTFPFELISNHIVLPVAIKGSKVKLILDTGMPMDGALLFGSQTIDALNLPFAGKAPVVGAADGTAVVSDLAMGIDFKLPGVEFSGQTIIVLPYDSVRNNQLEGVDGVIGTSIFGHFVTSIDYDSMKITLMEPDSFNYSGKGQKVPLEIDRIPVISAEVETESRKWVPVKLAIDTGYSGTLSIKTGSTDGVAIPENHVEFFDFNIQKEISLYVGRIKGFRIGNFHLTDVVSFFNPDKSNGHGLLGQGVLKRFNVILDYSRKSMILEPNTKFREPFEFDMAGFQYIRTEEALLRITHIVQGSPAMEAGLKIGDLLETINGISVKELSLDRVRNILDREGDEVTLGLNRNGENIKVQFVLRRLI